MAQPPQEILNEPDNAPLATLAFLVIAIGGFIVTWYFNLQYLMQGGGLGPAEFFAAAFANPLTSAITIDIYLSAIAFSIWVISDSRHAWSSGHGLTS